MAEETLREIPNSRFHWFQHSRPIRKPNIGPDRNSSSTDDGLVVSVLMDIATLGVTAFSVFLAFWALRIGGPRLTIDAHTASVIFDESRMEPMMVFTAVNAGRMPAQLRSAGFSGKGLALAIKNPGDGIYKPPYVLEPGHAATWMVPLSQIRKELGDRSIVVGSTFRVFISHGGKRTFSKNTFIVNRSGLTCREKREPWYRQYRAYLQAASLVPVNVYEPGSATQEVPVFMTKGPALFVRLTLVERRPVNDWGLKADHELDEKSKLRVFVPRAKPSKLRIFGLRATATKTPSGPDAELFWKITWRNFDFTRGSGALEYVDAEAHIQRLARVQYLLEEGNED